tara:strand:- start:134 stop:286 length:153 start_codon:yes stop_codon:yes gene_type:complete
MKTIGYILRNWFKQETKYWLVIPKYVNTKKEKQQLIKTHIEFIKEKIEIK